MFSFLCISAMSSACLRYSLHRFPGSEARDALSQNSGIWPECVRNTLARSSMYRNCSPSASVTWRSLSPSRIMSSSTSSRCSAGPLPGFQPSSLLFHRPRSRPSSLSFCSSFLSFCFRIFFRLLSSCSSFLSSCSSFLSSCSSFLSFCSSFLSFCSSFLSFCSSFLSFCFRIFFSLLFSCCNLVYDLIRRVWHLM